MKEVVDWAVTNIGPNVLKYTTDSSEMQQLLRTGAIDAVGFWTASPGTSTSTATRTPPCSCRPTIYPANGYLWIPKGAPHPVLAQIFINWRLGKDVQFPNAWPIEHGPWSELSEGFLGPDYADQIPDWFKADYCKYYPNLDQIKTNFKAVDWAAYNAGGEGLAWTTTPRRSASSRTGLPADARRRRPWLAWRLTSSPSPRPIIDARARGQAAGARARLTTFAMLAPAALVAVAFMAYPLLFIFQMSFTDGTRTCRSTGRSTRSTTTWRWSGGTCRTCSSPSSWRRWRCSSTWCSASRSPTSSCARCATGRSSAAFMVFPMFGALYIAFGLRFILLPGGPATPLLQALGISGTQPSTACPSVVFAMSIFTFPFMVMNIGTALSNVDPTLEEAAACLGARPWQTFRRVLLPLTRAGIVAGMLMVFGWSIGTFAEPLLLGSINEQRRSPGRSTSAASSRPTTACRRRWASCCSCSPSSSPTSRCATRAERWSIERDSRLPHGQSAAARSAGAASSTS